MFTNISFLVLGWGLCVCAYVCVYVCVCVEAKGCPHLSFLLCETVFRWFEAHPLG